MKSVDVIFVKIYITESSHLLNTIVNYLKKEAKILGISIFRAISGFGDTSNHTTSLVDLSLDLPLAIEFFEGWDASFPFKKYNASPPNEPRPRNAIFYKLNYNNP